MPAAIAERKRRKDPLTIELNLEAPFRCRVALDVADYATMRERASGLGIGGEPTTEQLRLMVDVIAQLVRSCLVDSEHERFDQGRAAAADTTVDVAPDNAIDDETLLVLFRPLMDAYTSVPTQPAPPSSAGQGTTGTASAESPETLTPVELD